MGLSALLLALARCGSGAVLAGSWSGVLDGVTITLTIQQSATGLTGSGAFAGKAVVLTGTYTEPIVSLHITTPGVEPLDYTGMLDHDRIVGIVNGSGYTDQSLTLERQSR